MTVVIYHKPTCSKSRATLALIRAAGVEPVVIPYLETGWTRAQLLGLFAAAGVTPREALRAESARAAGLDLQAADDGTILAEMVARPDLVNRPFVCSPRGVRLCRPPELVRDLLGPPPTPL